MRLRGVLPFAAALCLVGIGACDSGPSGPGSLMGRVTGESLGGVVLEVVGAGIVGFEGRGDTQAYGAPMARPENTHRVILIDPQGGELLFEIQVDDVAMDGPVMTVLSATGVDNALQLLASVEVRVER